MFNAATEFTKSIKTVRDMIAEDKTFDQPTGLTHPGKSDLSDGIRASATVLPVGFFEEFLRALVGEFIDAINSKNPRLSWEKVPEQLRKCHVFDTVVTLQGKKLPPGIMYEDHENRVLNEIRANSVSLLSPLTDPTSYTLVSSGFLTTNNNPDSETVSEMMKKINCPSVFSNAYIIQEMKVFDASLSSRDAIVLKLDSIVDARHTVAHGKRLRGLNRNDIEYNVNFLCSFATCLQTLVATLSDRLLS